MDNNSNLLELYKSTRENSLQLISNQPIEDLCVQPASFTSPIKWHIAHTTWIYEKSIQQITNQESYNEKYDHLFNSYYKGIGNHWSQDQRGQLSRPTLAQVLKYKKDIDQMVISGLEQGVFSKNAIELAIEHEVQHQELMVMDLKYILSLGIGFIENSDHFMAYDTTSLRYSEKYKKLNAGITQVGHDKNSFCFDNELPRHDVLLQNVEIHTGLVTNGEYLEFINSGAYLKSNLWLSDGWEWINSNNVNAPLYWIKEKNEYEEVFFGIKRAINMDAPVSHISYYEADAYARFKGKRIPSEFELELYLSQSKKSQLWAWSKSSYQPYPGFKPFEGFAKEYNGKFMSGQIVLKGGSLATPDNHYRPSYRNFFRPSDRWQFSGIKLAKEIL
jgi:ergothioneine biosynthesis protein EgtB